MPRESSWKPRLPGTLTRRVGAAPKGPSKDLTQTHRHRLMPQAQLFLGRSEVSGEQHRPWGPSEGPRRAACSIKDTPQQTGDATRGERVMHLCPQAPSPGWRPRVWGGQWRWGGYGGPVSSSRVPTELGAQEAGRIRVSPPECQVSLRDFPRGLRGSIHLQAETVADGRGAGTPAQSMLCSHLRAWPRVPTAGRRQGKGGRLGLDGPFASHTGRTHGLTAKSWISGCGRPGKEGE